jgi:5S rRNA maturation endonuclease (ribonuclease M5)
MTPEEIVTLLDARDLHPTASGPGKWEALCPAHEDRKASLSIGAGQDDRVLLHCHAGCDHADVLAGLGLTATDLFATNGNGNGQPAEEYIYLGATGAVVMKAVRKPGKKFAQAQPDGTGGWIWNLQGVERVLYRLPKVLAAVAAKEIIYVCEGEKDVAALERAGVVATTNPGGAGKWRPDYSKTLAGAAVVVIADRDEPGMKHARTVAKSLTAQKCSVRIVRAGEGMGKDAHDHLAGGGGVEDFVPIAEDPQVPDQSAPAADSASSDPRQAGDLLAEVGDFVDRFVVLPSDAAAAAISLFVLHTWAIEAAHATPYLAIVSAEKQSGKTRLLEVLWHLVREPWHTASTTEAALFRKIETVEPCLLLDEIDAIFGSNSERTEPLRAALNAGNRRGASATRVVGQGTAMEVKDFSVFCPKVLAGIDTGRLPETIRDRSIELRMKRRRDGERVERLRQRFVEREIEPLRAALAAWATESAERLRDDVPALPDDLSDRAADAWEPLLAIADRAGGDWPARARSAAVELSTTDDGDEVGRGPQLLAGIRKAIGSEATITTADLLRAINGDDELPFGGWRDGKGLDARTLARLLKPYEVRPRTIRVGEETPKGYRAEDLRDAWARYLPPSEAKQAKHPQHGEKPQPENARKHGAVADVADVAPLAGPGADVADHDDDLSRKVRDLGAMSAEDAEREWQRLAAS